MRHFHLPKACKVESSTPLAAAVLAAPIRNECPVKKDESTPAALRVDSAMQLMLPWTKGSLHLVQIKLLLTQPFSLQDTQELPLLGKDPDLYAPGTA